MHQLCLFLEVKVHYNKTQSGFRKGHSTTTLLLKFRDDFKHAMNTSEVTLGILLDYSKTFNTIDHLRLLEKLHKLIFSKQALNLIHSYVSGRKQFVHDKHSPVKFNKFGVPQGSILGPVLFNLYVVDLVENIICDSLQYANDSTSKPKNLTKCIEELKSDLETVSIWSSSNSFVFNNDSSQLSQRHNLSNNELFRVMHNGEAIGRVHTQKVLGIHFDENLSWLYHVNNIIQSFYATVRSPRQFKRFAPYKVRKCLFFN